MRISYWSSDVCFFRSGRAGDELDRPAARVDQREHQVVVGTAAQHDLEPVLRGELLEVELDRLVADRPHAPADPAPQLDCQVACRLDPARKSVVEGQSVSVRVNHGGPRNNKKKKK